MHKYLMSGMAVAAIIAPCAQAQAQSFTRAEISEAIKGAVLEVAPALETERIDDSTNFRESGLNSLDRADVYMITLEKLSVNIPLRAAAHVRTVGEFADFVMARTQNPSA